ncbi:hypothetical protein SLS53_004310 [Cytospora paraplurivora]|uniref:Ribosomal protein S21 n=1 Tax=Cytospora paraplurivora TaxID=2898453 RepID=A0AAN9YHV8_9PEZI
MELRPIQTALLAGRAASRWTSSATPAMPSLHRQFATTRAFLAESGTAASAPAPSMVAWKKNFEEQRQQKQQQRQQDPASRQAGGARSSTNIYSFLSQKPNSSPGASSSPSPTGMGKGSSLDTPWAQPSRTRRGSGSDSGLRNNKNSSNLIEDLGIFADLNSAPRPALDDFAAAHQHKKESIMDVKLRLRPSIGRTVHCGKGSKVDLARGLQLLNTQVRRNKVSQDLSRQRFHERPGLKRKRLRRERWRARFKDGFKATCGRVRELARQGW